MWVLYIIVYYNPKSRKWSVVYKCTDYSCKNVNFDVECSNNDGFDAGPVIIDILGLEKWILT